MLNNYNTIYVRAGKIGLATPVLAGPLFLKVKQNSIFAKGK